MRDDRSRQSLPLSFVEREYFRFRQGAGQNERDAQVLLVRVAISQVDPLYWPRFATDGEKQNKSSAIDIIFAAMLPIEQKEISVASNFLPKQ